MEVCTLYPPTCLYELFYELFCEHYRLFYELHFLKSLVRRSIIVAAVFIQVHVNVKWKEA